jgi:hypothetical protein
MSLHRSRAWRIVCTATALTALWILSLVFLGSPRWSALAPGWNIRYLAFQLRRTSLGRAEGVAVEAVV